MLQLHRIKNTMILDLVVLLVRGVIAIFKYSIMLLSAAPGALIAGGNRSPSSSQDLLFGQPQCHAKRKHELTHAFAA